ncbi:MATE family efflux transporter [Leptolyngbya sp. FACHB-261]|uniref:MATE family efflux transporter n=1 Tax=Leptolyngbya sp. FACHB-261 TaxID=2692806 RepID=UPI001685A682|nr:MATE family efflux transporter [Leptolyngbya sp. FACHB-261]MBD2103106.1 MATE family efflux transporter [Leptolyngbya sp. FACHB-261]
MGRAISKLQLTAEVQACLTLAVPLVGARLAEVATGFTDTVMMGLLGSEVLAGGALGSIVFTWLLYACVGVTTAVTPLVAEAHGAQQPAEVGRVASQSLWLLLVLAIPAILLLWNMGPVLRLLGQDAKIVALAETYLQAIACGFLPAIAFAILSNIVAALSRPQSILIITVAGVLLNVAANYVLMFGKFGLPALGLAGIGWGSTLSYWAMFATLAIYVMRRPDLKAYGLFQHLQRLRWPMLREILRLGWPSGVVTAAETGLFTITGFFMGYLGTDVLAAHQIALQTAAVTFMVPSGIARATAVRVSQTLGGGDASRSRLAGYVALGMGIAFMGCMTLLFWLCPANIVGLYLDIGNPDNFQVTQIAIALLRVGAVFQIFDAVQIIATGALRGLKDTHIPMVIAIFTYWCVGLTSGYLLGIQFNLGGVGFWWGLVLGLASAGTILTWRFHALISPLVRRQQLLEMGSY